ncbi:MAG: hypothetical protein K2K80_07010, partial [Clostridia bacterium]|nr:hypothetical protein [Clostridia bacterium]
MENKNLQEFIADLQSKSLNSENDTRAVLSVTGSAADAESFNGYNYKELALSNKATGYLDLNKGNLVIEIGSVNTEEFVLPFTIALIHKSNNASGKLGEGWRLSLNKQLKLAENDTDKTTKYTYKDEKGDTYTFDEKYYIFENGAKTFLSKEKITIDLNANLTYNNKPVYKRQFCKGYTLIPAINDFVNSELIEQRQSEQVELEDYIRQIEPSLKSYVIINSANGGKIRELAGLNKNAYDQFISGVESNAGAILVTKRQSFKLRELYNKLAVESDSALIQAQIDEIISRAQDNLPVIKEEFKKYFGKKAELELLLKQIPVNYLRDENGVINGFNKNGDLVLMADSYGNYFSIEYNSKNLIVGIYDNNKKVVNFEYKNDLLQSVTDKRGRQVKYGYDSSDRLTTVTYPDGQTCAITYTSNHRIATLTDGYGNRSEFTYSGTKLSGLTAKNTLTNNTVSTLTAEYTDNSVKLTSDKGESEEYQFNAENKLLKLVTSDERNYIKTRQYSYANNNKTVTCMEDENVSSYYVRDIKEYDELDLLTTYTVDWHNVSYNAREKTVSKYSYDSDNKLVSKKTKQYIETDSDPGEDGTIENFEYNHVENYSYDTNGNLTLTESYTEEEKQTAGVNFVERVYNDDGNMIKCIRWNSLDSSTKFYEECERDKDGTVRYGQDETGAYSTLYEYVSGTNVINSVTYSNGGKIAYGRNPHNNQITAVTQSTAEGEANTTNIVYENGLPVKVTSGNTTLEYKYDGKGRKTEVKLNGTTQTTYAYDDSRSNASGTYNFGGQSVTYATGGSGVKISKTVQGKSGSSALQLTEYTKINDNTVIRQTDYNATGSVRRIIDNTRAGRIGRTTYDYDDYGNLTRITSLNSDNTAEILREERSYTMRGELSSKIFRGEVKQVYYYAYRENSTCELASVVIDGYSFTPLTDVYGRNTGKEIYNTTNRIAGEYITYRKVGDHATNMPATVWFANGSEIKDSIKYKYDSCGNICEITQNGHTEIRYTYDALNRLIREDNKPLNKTVIYSYDNAGNITQRCKYDYTEYSVVPHNGGNNHYKYEYNGDKLVSYNGEACEYNNIGNPTKYRGKVCEWQYGTQLTKYGTTEFKYDCFGRRVKKINGNTEDKYTYDNDGRLIQQKIGPKDNEVEQDNQYTQFIYDASGLAGVCFKRETYFYRKDAQGNIIAILDKNGKVV